MRCWSHWLAFIISCFVNKHVPYLTAVSSVLASPERCCFDNVLLVSSLTGGTGCAVIVDRRVPGTMSAEFSRLFGACWHRDYSTSVGFEAA
jgi:hypothetical protein